MGAGHRPRLPQGPAVLLDLLVRLALPPGTELNKLDHFQADLDGVRIHFVHETAKQGNGVPLILTHGWPSWFVEYLPLVPLLTEHSTW